MAFATLSYQRKTLGKRSRPRQISANGYLTPLSEIDDLSLESPRPLKSPRLILKYNPRRLEHLSAEILEKIAWLSLNPNITITSKKLSVKLPNRWNFKVDLLMLAFCGWNDARINPDGIDWLTLAARNDLLILSEEEKDDLQRRCLGASWCKIGILKEAAFHLALTWLRRNWSFEFVSPEKYSEYNSLLTSKLDIFNKGRKSVTFRKVNDRDHYLQVQNFSKMQVRCKGSCSGNHQCKQQDQNLIFATNHVPSRLFEAPFTRDKLELMIFLRCCRASTADATPICSLTDITDAIFAAIEQENEMMISLLMEMRESVLANPGPFEFFPPDQILNQTREMLLTAVCQKKYNILIRLLKTLLDRGFDSSEMLDRVLWYARRDWQACHQGAANFRHFYYGQAYQLLGRLERPARVHLSTQYPVDYPIHGEKVFGPSIPLV